MLKTVSHRFGVLLKALFTAMTCLNIQDEILEKCPSLVYEVRKLRSNGAILIVDISLTIVWWST